MTLCGWRHLFFSDSHFHVVLKEKNSLSIQIVFQLKKNDKLPNLEKYWLTLIGYSLSYWGLCLIDYSICWSIVLFL